MTDDKPFYFTTDEWSALPLKLRQRWWRETAHGTIAPSEELLDTCRARDDGTVVAVGGEPGASAGASE